MQENNNERIIHSETGSQKKCLENLSSNNNSLEKSIANKKTSNNFIQSIESNLEIKNTNTRKSKAKNRRSIELQRKDFLLDDIYGRENICGVQKKFKNSLIYTGHKIKETIERDLSAHMGANGLPNKEIDKKEETKSGLLNQSFNSILKKNIQKSMQNKNLKKRRKLLSEKAEKIIKEKNRKLFQIKHVYDSLEDSEDNYNSSEETSFFISPESKFIYFFDFIIIICLAICIIYIPLKIAFHKNDCFNLSVFDRVIFDFIDIIFIIDFIISFYRGYYNNELKLINDSKIIIKNYLSTFFIYDLIAALPCCSFLIYYYKDVCSLNSNNNQYLFILLISILKLFKSIKIRKNNKFIENIYELISKNFLAEQIFVIIKMFLMTLSILHILVCCHIFIGYHFYPSWLFSLKGNNSINDNLSIYIASLYCLITTLTTVGYGDIVCISFPERIFQLIELSLGVIFYSYIISKLGDYVKIESYATMIYNNNSAILEEIRITHPKMPFKLYNQILHHLQSNFQQQKKSDINVLINSLPHALKYQLLFVMNKNYVDNFHFFKKCYNSNFISYTLLNFVPITYKKNVLIIKEDQLIDNVVFVVDGRLSLEIAIDLENPEKSINKYLSDNYNPLKSEEHKNENSTIKHNLSFIEKMESKKTDINNLKTLITKYTDIMKERGMNFSRIERDFDESNFQFLNISNIFKNEHYGEVFIALNKPSPLFLRVKSKKANIFLLNKKHILHLSENFSNIWKRLYQKSLKNMKAYKQKTLEVAKKYTLKNNVKYSTCSKKGNKKNKNDNKKLSNINKRKSKMNNARNSLKCFLAKDIEDIRQLSFDQENIGDKEDKEEKKEGKEGTANKKEKSEEIHSNNNCEDTSLKKNINNNIIINKENEDLKISKTVDLLNNNRKRMHIEKAKLFEKISTRYLQSPKNTINNLDKNHIKKLLMKLRKEIEKRNNYLKLINESNKKIKTLYSQLVNNSIDITRNIDNLDKCDSELYSNLDLSKVLLNNINNNNIISTNLLQNKKGNNNSLNKSKNKINKNIFSQSFCPNKINKSFNINKINKEMISNSLSFNQKKSAYNMSENKNKNKIKSQLSKFDNKKSIEQIFINLNQPVLILNTSKSLDNRENKDKKEINTCNTYNTHNKFLSSIKRNNNNTKDNSFDQNQSLSPFLSYDNSISNEKIKKKDFNK